MEVMIAVTMMVCFEGNDIKELLYNLEIFILFAFIMELLKSFDKIMIVGD